MADLTTLEDAIRKLTEQNDRTARAVEELARRAAQNDDRWGLFAESMVAPACERLFTERGIPVHGVARRFKARKGDRGIEIDILVVNDGHVVAVEVKVNLRSDDIQEHLERLVQFKEFFPQYADRKLLGAVAGMTIAEGVDRHAYREGLFVLTRSGDTVTILNDAAFRPREW